MDGSADNSSTGRGTGTHCTSCGAPFLPQASFCGSCGAARWTSGTAPQEPHGADGARPGARRGVAIASVTALALVGGAVGGILWTRQSSSPPTAPTSSIVVAGPTKTTATTTATAAATTPAPRPSPASTARDFADLYRDVSSGVVRIQATTCDGGGIGTGFLIAPDLVATVAHVVNQSAALNLTVGDKGAGGTTSGVVVGIDPSADVALVRLDRPIQGHVFTLADEVPQVGQEVAAIGFPVGDPMTLTRGTVSGLDRTIPIEDVQRSGLIETDAAVNPGNSGGPLLSADGQVLGLVDAKHMNADGIAYAVAPTIAHPLLDSWDDNTTSAITVPCTDPEGPQPGQDLTPTVPGSPDATTQSVADVFKTYFGGINSANYKQAWLMLSPKLRGPSWSSFAKGTSTSYDTQVAILSVLPGPGESVTAHVTFTSVQTAEKGPDGDTCDNWDLDYTLIPADGSWLIDKVVGHDGGPTHTTC